MEDIKSGRVIKGSNLDKTIISFIHNNWPQSKSGIFPGPQPISIERKHFKTLFKGDHLVCEKTDGVRHLFVAFLYKKPTCGAEGPLTSCNQGVSDAAAKKPTCETSCNQGSQEKKVSFLVNRSYDITVVPNVFAKHVYDGTILDGELIEKEFLIYDGVLVSGTNVITRNLIERLTCAETVTKGVLRVANQIAFKMKSFSNLNDQNFWNTLPLLKHKTDGLVFTPVSDPVMIGTHENMFKWKPLEKNTIDFLAKFNSRGSKWDLYVLEKGNLVFESEVPLHLVPQGINITENAIVECEYKFKETPRWWKPLNIRTDKSHPNNRRTFYNTLTNIKEDIQMKEFIMR
jgi:mRNA guanylyltransferase